MGSFEKPGQFLAAGEGRMVCTSHSVASMLGLAVVRVDGDAIDAAFTAAQATFGSITGEAS